MGEMILCRSITKKNLWRFEMIEIKDNYLDKELFARIKNLVLTSQNIPWFLQTNVSGEGLEEHSYFTHLLFSNNRRNSNNFEDIVTPLFFVMGGRALIRAKLNLYPKTETLYHHKDHIDYNYEHKGAIFYLNTNDGYTVIGDTKVESVENRLLRFDPTIPHHSTTCTDANYRCNLNLNYY